MDASIAAAARALAAGDPLAALQRVALRDDPDALALRGIAMAQLGEYARARQLLQRAARSFGEQDAAARARCAIAQAEIALAARELGRPIQALAAAERVLRARGDRANALHARLVAARRELLLGRISGAERGLARCSLQHAPPRLAAIGELVNAEIAVRRVRPLIARAALARAAQAARRAGIPALAREVEDARAALEAPVARALARGREAALRLEEVERLLGSGALVVDRCRRAVRSGPRAVPLARRPVLFALLRALAEAWPADLARDELIAAAFGARRSNPSHRARLRVELGRLRAQLRGFARVEATARGYALAAPPGREVVVLAPLHEDADSAVLALLADGTAWSTSALALALGTSQRTVQRVLLGLEQIGRVRAHGRGRARRWLAQSVAGSASVLLLPLGRGLRRRVK